MKVKVRRLGILQFGMILGMVYGFFALIILPIMAISFFLGGGPAETMGGPGEMIFMLFMILLYPVMGFIAGIFGAALYNLVARIVGGVKMELDVEPIPTADTTLGA